MVDNKKQLTTFTIRNVEVRNLNSSSLRLDNAVAGVTVGVPDVVVLRQDVDEVLLSFELVLDFDVDSEDEAVDTEESFELEELEDDFVDDEERPELVDFREDRELELVVFKEPDDEEERVELVVFREVDEEKESVELVNFTDVDEVELALDLLELVDFKEVDEDDKDRVLELVAFTADEELELVLFTLVVLLFNVLEALTPVKANELVLLALELVFTLEVLVLTTEVLVDTMEVDEAVQPPVILGTAFAPLPIATIFDPQFAACAIWMLKLS
ncbi:uncharacterized protein LY89DRAFT_676376 [Mollisia scopiformis]|uniref:Uncharacterized protein n=1 Tax=Mollisia scopiformis TaxID=149040 RepID=A0A132B9B8_MOLSC|nr:uncharacterized protein LY89DRAFT_676376 [Mollisia scopiformis]KUJ09000.1 hypothetical protein LY89DRAFT_676376 [Mollisia scopiformis]